jgi:hypothetical protein
MVALVAIAAVSSAFVYRPDRSLPFDFLDFSEFLPILQGSEGFFGRLSGLLDYYAGDHGRLSVVAYALLAAKWELFGTSSPGWQWMRFGTMWLAVILVYLLLCRLRVGHYGSMAGASLFLFAPPAAEGWIRLTMAEPTGTVLLLLLCLLALRPTEGSEWRLGLLFGCISAVLILLKEMLAATLILPIALAAIVPEFSGSRLIRIRTLSLAALTAVLSTGIPIAVVALRSADGSYTADFGSSVRPFTDAIAQWTLALLPFDPGSAFPAQWTGAALLAFIGLVATGWRLMLTASSEERAGAWRLLALCLSYSLSGVILYLPWPAYNRFYAIPYLLSGAVLAAGALSAIAARSRSAGRLAYLVWGLFVVFAAGDAAARARRTAARQVLNAKLVHRLSVLAEPTDTVWIATDQRVPAEWQGVGPTLQRFGAALGYAMPHLLNAPCEDSRRIARERRGHFVFYSSLCPTTADGESIVEPYLRPALPAIRPVPDSIRVDLIVPQSSLLTHGGS